MATTLGAAKGDTQRAGRGAFGVAFAGPRGEVSDLAEPAITVLFNRAMRDPDSADTAGIPPVRLEASTGVPVAGAWRWVGTHGLLFTPEHPLPGSTKFHVTVPAGVRSQSGETLSSDYAFDLSSPRPAVVDMEPSDGAKDVRTDVAFRLAFNQPMDPATVERAVHLNVQTAPGNTRPVAVNVVHAKKPKGQIATEQILVLTPKEKLPKDTAVELVIDGSLHGAGPLTVKSPRTLHFRTYGPLALETIICPRSTGPRCQAHRDFTVSLTNAVDPEEFKAHLQAPGMKFVKPGKNVGKKRKPGPAKQVLLAADPEFGKRYHLTVTKGLHDVFGQVLDHDLSFDVDTEDPWSADAKAKPASPAAHVASIDPPSSPNRPHRLRLDYGVQLGVSGHVVEALASTGIKSHKVPVSDVNIPMYGMFQQKLDEDDALAWLENRWESRPGSAGFRWDWVSPNVPDNTRDVRTIDLDALLGGAGHHGAALMALNLPGDGIHDRNLLTVTDLGVSAEVSRFGSVVWVTHLSNGQPVAGATVTLQGVPKDLATTVTTDATGVATIPPSKWFKGRDNREPYLFVHAGDDWTYAKVERSRASYSTGVEIDVDAETSWGGMLYADRGVYRPGETVKLSGVFRKVDAGGVTIAPNQEARVLVEDAQGEKIFDGITKLGAFGELAADVQLSKTSHLGNATIKVELGRKDTQMFSAEVLLAAYKASEFKVAVEPAAKVYVRGDTATFGVHADYLFGAPMGDAKYRTTVVRRVSPFAPPHSEGFITNDDVFAIDHTATNPAASQLKDGEGELDATGHAEATVPMGFANMRAPEEVTLEAEVTDLSQASIAKRASIRLHPAAFYLGLGELPSRFVSVGADISPKVVAFDAFDPGGKHVPGVKAKVELVQRVWTTATIDEAADVPRRTARLHDEVVATCDATTTAEIASCQLHVDKPGYFFVRVSAKDERGNPSGASMAFYCVADKNDTVVSWAPPSSSRHLSLEADKKLYEPGDVAKILVQNPFKAAEALVTVERGGVLDQRVVALNGPMPLVEVPVKSSYFPNAFINIRLVRGRIADPPAQGGADVGAPDFRLGVVPIAVNPASHRLVTKVTTDKKEYQPGSEVLADVFVTGRDGAAANAEVTFYAVDEGVLMLTGYETPDPLPAFSEARRLAVFATESREDLAHVLLMKNGEHIRPLGYDYLYAAGPGEDKGGDGGDGGGAGAGPRFDFKTTAFFEAGKVTDGEGHAKYRFKLPDNLTTFRVMAITAGADDRFGAGDAQLITNKHLMARPVMPRVVRLGDTFEAGVILSSKDLPAGTAHVSIAPKGIDVIGSMSRDVTVPAGGSVEVRFPFLATHAGPATFSFDAQMQGGAASDRVLVTRAVSLPLSLDTVSTYGETTSPVAVKLDDLSQLRPDEGGLEVHLASTALVGLGTSFDRLIEYPYGCTEQLTSRILPLLVLPDLAAAVGAHLPARVADAVDDGIGKLLEHQTGTGGFNYWGGDDDPQPWLSAFAMLAVEGAARKGLFVPRDARDTGIAYLHRVLDHAVPAEDDDTHPPDERDDSASNTPSPEIKKARLYADLVFAADTLATLGSADASSLERLFAARAGRPLFTQALLLHAMAVAHRPVSQLDTVAAEIVARVRSDASDAYADEVSNGFDEYLDSSTRTSALVLRALLAAHPDHPLASRLAHGLLTRREGGAWRSTQENVWALMALADYQKAQESVKPDFDAKVFLGGSKVGEGHFHGGSSEDQAFSVNMAKVFPESGHSITFDVSGHGKLFYAAELRTATTVLPTKPRDSGMFVQKIVRALSPSDLAAAQKVLPQHGDTRAKPGDLVLVDLLLESAEPREQVVIDDPMPSGLEPIDFALATSAESQRVSDDGPHGNEKHKALFQYGVAFGSPVGMHREQHDDKVLTFLSHIDPGIYHFRYLARATTPGDFVVPPTRASCMYSPEISGASAATRFVVAAPDASAGGGVKGALAKAP